MLNIDDLYIVDAQIHIWGANRPDRPWPPHLAGNAHGQVETTAETVLVEMDAGGVTGAVLVPAGFEGNRNDLALEAAKRNPGRFRVFGRFPLDEPDVGDRMLEAMRDPYLLGVRISFLGFMKNWLVDGTLDWFWPFAEQHGIPVTMYPIPEHLRVVAEIASSHPALRISIDHMALRANRSERELEEDLGKLKPLSRCANVAVKCSALPCSLSDRYSTTSVRQVLDLVLDWFGPARVFWGSDLTRCPGQGYRNNIVTYLEALGGYPNEVVRLVMGDGLRRWIGWERDGERASGSDDGGPTGNS